MPRYMLILRPITTNEAEAPMCYQLPEMGHMIEKLSDAGILLAAEGLHTSDRGARVRLADGEFSVTDGPFTEAKELVAGFALVDVESREAAVALARQILQVGGEGQSDVREVMELPRDQA